MILSILSSRHAKFLIVAAVLVLAAVFFVFWRPGKSADALPFGFDIADVHSGPVIRVLLFDKLNKCMFRVESDFELLDDNDVMLCRFSRTRGDVYAVCDANGWQIGTESYRPGNISIMPSDGIFTLNGQRFRGRLKLIADVNSGTFQAINYLPIEQYLAGVIGAEMPDYWEFDALQAQAVAARSYAMHITRRFGVSRNYDLSRTQANQVYAGIAAESTRTILAIKKTLGTVLTYRDGKEQRQILPAYYASVCGGHTEDAAMVFGEQAGVVPGVRCRFCRYVAQKEFYKWPPVEYDINDISRRIIARYSSLKKLGDIKQILIKRASDYGRFQRITMVRLTGSDGVSDALLRGEDFRLAVDPTGNKIRSAAFDIKIENGKALFYKGRGFGHGVGLCQCGAQRMAAKGADYRKILRHYYPAAKLEKIY